jgi:hypothetical protein
MKTTLAGPDDLGFWFLHDDDGNSFPLVARHEDHPVAARMLGWQSREGITDAEAIIQDALEWLMEHIGEDFEAPHEVVAYFDDLQEDGEVEA